MSSERPPDGPLGFGDDEDEESREAPGQEASPSADAPPRAEPPSGKQSYQPRGTPVDTAKYTWFVGIAAVILIAYVFISGTINNDGPGSLGIKRGHIIPPFAAPLAIGGEVGDVNTATKPNQGPNGKVPACSIHKATVLTICDLYDRGPVVLAFFATRGSQCTEELDAIANVALDFPRISVAAVAIRGDLGDLRKLVTKRGWPFPVAYDRDGQLSNKYGVAICPQITYVRRGGRVAGTTFGVQDERKLRQRFAALAAGRIVPR